MKAVVVFLPLVSSLGDTYSVQSVLLLPGLSCLSPDRSRALARFGIVHDWDVTMQADTAMLNEHTKSS